MQTNTIGVLVARKGTKLPYKVMPIPNMVISDAKVRKSIYDVIKCKPPGKYNGFWYIIPLFLVYYSIILQ